MSSRLSRADPSRRGVALGQPWPPSTRIWTFSAILAGLAFLIYRSQLADLPTPPAQLLLPWPILAVAFAAAELKVVQVHFRRETHSFSLSEFPAVIGFFFLSPFDYVVACSSARRSHS